MFSSDILPLFVIKGMTVFRNALLVAKFLFLAESFNVKYFTEIKRLKGLQKAEAYLEPKRVSMVKVLYENS